VYVDTAQTYRLTFISLAIGLIIAVPLGLLLYSLRQPLTANTDGVQFSWGALFLPLTAVVVIGILGWAVFRLPVRFAKRQGIILDPEVWPWTGAVALGVLTGIGFFGAIVLGLI
jgi:hypothetical protein